MLAPDLLRRRFFRQPAHRRLFEKTILQHQDFIVSFQLATYLLTAKLDDNLVDDLPVDWSAILRRRRKTRPDQRSHPTITGGRHAFGEEIGPASSSVAAFQRILMQQPALSDLRRLYGGGPACGICAVVLRSFDLRPGPEMLRAEFSQRRRENA